MKTEKEKTIFRSPYEIVTKALVTIADNDGGPARDIAVTALRRIGIGYKL